MSLAAARQRYEEKAESAPSSSHGLLSVIGQARAMGGGYGAFMTKTVLTSSTAGVIFGLSGFMLASITGPLYCPLVGYLLGSQFGFLGGLITCWTTDKEAAIRAIELYPEVMHHHLRSQEPCKYRVDDIHAWKQDIRRNLRKQGMAIAALHSSQDALTQLRDAEEQRLVDALIAAGGS